MAVEIFHSQICNIIAIDDCEIIFFSFKLRGPGVVASSFNSMTKGHANGLLFDSHVRHTPAEDLYWENSPISSDKNRVSANLLTKSVRF